MLVLAMFGLAVIVAIVVVGGYWFFRRVPSVKTPPVDETNPSEGDER